MRCTNCRYELMNIGARSCPECGAAFRPSDFRFRPYAVRFCCPHCDQSYYGAAEDGHLDPRSFTCVKCEQAIDMDDMVVRAVDGQGQGTNVLPWADESYGVFRRWIATAWRALIMPTTLARELHPKAPLGSAVAFAGLSSVIYLALGAGTIALLIAIAFVRQPGDLAQALVVGLSIIFGGTVLVLVGTLVGGLVIHGLLRLTGGTAHGLSRTLQLLFFAVGATAFWSIPLLGIYPFGFVGGIWWIVSAILLVSEGQKVHGGRATFAVLTLPALAVGAMILMAVAGSMAASFAINRQMASDHVQKTSMVATALLGDTAANGAWPVHGLALVDGATLTPTDLVGTWTDTSAYAVPVGDSDLGTYATLGTAAQRSVLDLACADLPADVVAHRVGDFVFTYHGIDPARATADGFGDLWIVVFSPDPTYVDTLPTDLHVADAAGTVTTLSADAVGAALTAQNARRAEAGLAPLKSPWLVRHGSPQGGAK